MKVEIPKGTNFNNVPGKPASTLQKVPDDHKPTEPVKAPPVSEILMQIIEDRAFLFRDKTATAYASIDGECLPVRSTRFKRKIQRLYHIRNKKVPHTQAMQDSIDQAEGKALFEGGEYEVSVRSAFINNKILIDLGDDNKTIIEVSKDGWKFGTEERVFFYRPSGLNKLPRPEQCQDITLLRQFVNVATDADFRLFVAYLLAAFHPGIAAAILNLLGEQGSAKSTQTKMLRSLIDPNAAPIRTAPRDERELIIQAQNSRMLCFDNLSGVKSWLSDALCRICTGGGFSARKLYTNDEEMIFQIRRPIILNGIDDIATRGDLLDRSIVINLPAIPQEQRKDETKFWNDFEALRPKIIGALLHGLSYGLKYQDEIKHDKLPRMADFARFIAGCEKAYNWPEGTLIADYNRNRGQAVETGLDSDILASAIRAIMKDLSKWTGTATELIEKIEKVAGDVDARYLPSTRTLKSRLTRLSPALRQIGITWDRTRTENGTEYFIKNSGNNVQVVQELQEGIKNNGLEAGTTLAEMNEPASSARNVQGANSLADNDYCTTGRTGRTEQELFNNDTAPF
ncbi:MAG: hypothetical protein JJU13_07420 [Balneolaceae bacterium]|nr:hypothetical protein [Balneolaceae bacterium]